MVQIAKCVQSINTSSEKKMSPYCMVLALQDKVLFIMPNCSLVTFFLSIILSGNEFNWPYYWNNIENICVITHFFTRTQVFICFEKFHAFVICTVTNWIIIMLTYCFHQINKNGAESILLNHAVLMNIFQNYRGFATRIIKYVHCRCSVTSFNTALFVNVQYEVDLVISDGTIFFLLFPLIVYTFGYKQAVVRHFQITFSMIMDHFAYKDVMD